MAVSSDHRFVGIGSALIDAVASTVAAQGRRELWLVTTNDNVDAATFPRAKRCVA